VRARDARHSASARPATPLRLDIQVLRAVAVGAVVVYHLWPNRLPGGFIGVDVFFVISGFLITSHLVRGAVTQRDVDVVAFWGNRARRLLPLACVVLLVTLGGVRWWAPPSSWTSSFENVIASALYVQNWKLSADAVDYLARDRVPPPTQHYWSLSAEEQFYLLWPLVVVAGTFVAVRVARRRGIDRSSTIRSTVLVLLLAITGASFVYSLVLTRTSPDLAYFATTTRAWEFGAGALLAFVPVAAARRWRAAAAALGLLTIAGACLLLPEGTPFPGVAALLPVLGAAAFIWAGGADVRWSPKASAALRPLTWIGDLSYGIYLWHWPLISLAPFALDLQQLRTVDKLAIAVLSVALAAASKTLVEDPFRYGSTWRVDRRRSFYPAAVGMAAVCAVAVAGLQMIETAVVPPATAASAPRLSIAAGTDQDEPLRPTLVGRSTDTSIMYDCFNLVPTGEALSCTYGDPSSTTSIAIVGDSHSAHLLPGLIDAVDANGWKLTTFVGIHCDAAFRKDCAEGRKTLATIARSGFDLVLFSAYRGSDSTLAGVTRTVSTLQRAGVPIVPVVDVPTESVAAYQCVENSGGDAGRAARCTTPVATALEDEPDRNTLVARRLGLPLIDMTDEFCDAARCYSVINNVIVNNTVISKGVPRLHVTTTFSRLLAPRLAVEVEKALTTRSTATD
jgi:peptidoglycan/LPS O-acetylase OafA/YrhL